ncbi:pentapeptide repeat-containing protein [Nocardia wallacei]|uniref:pentapeptide repeat-containing protein n=1 Tax=Nocardia wallacei TaxID=480035 RepID=UPI002457E581|nr:pentapeptide repeat-containing protein [Nocardia wallacei]
MQVNLDAHTYLAAVDRLGSSTTVVRAAAVRLLNWTLSGGDSDVVNLVLHTYADLLRVHSSTDEGYPDDLPTVDVAAVLAILPERLSDRRAATAVPKLDLTRVRLRNAELPDITLPGARLVSADLTRANLHRADLSNADLSGADLSYANLSGARLRGARLIGAKLYHTVMNVTEVSDADFTDAVLRPDSLRDTDLGTARGLTEDQLRQAAESAAAHNDNPATSV